MAKRLSQREIAKALDVSQAAVSCALRDPNSKFVSDETRQRIIDYVARADPAQVPPWTRNGIGVFLRRSALESEILLRTIQSAEEEAAGRKLDIVLKTWTDEMHLCELAAMAKEEAILVLGAPDQEELRQIACRKPMVLLDAWLESLFCDVVNEDVYAGIQKAVQHLHQHGHRDIAYVGSLGGVSEGRIAERVGAYFESMIGVGLSFSTDYVINMGSVDCPTEEDAARNVLELNPKPTAVIASSDRSLMMMMGVWQRMGIAIPGDLSVVGYDDLESSAYWPVPVTTVRPNREEMGRTGVRLLIELLEKPQDNERKAVGLLDDLIEFERRPQKILCQPKLVERQSVSDV